MDRIDEKRRAEKLNIPFRLEILSTQYIFYPHSLLDNL